MTNEEMKAKLNNIRTLQQLLKTYRDDMFEIMESRIEIENIINDEMSLTFDRMIDDTEKEINKIENELNFMLDCINQLNNSEDREIITELYVNQKPIKDIENKLGIEHTFMLETLNEIYIQLEKKNIRKNRVNDEL